MDLTTDAAAPDLINLVEGIAKRDSSFPAGAANRYIESVFDAEWANQRELELWEKLPRDECLRYSTPGEPITLAVARRIAYRLDVSILDLLESDRPATRSFGFAAEGALPAQMRPCKKSMAIDRAALAKSLRHALDDNREPLSLRQVARSLSVSVGAIRYHWPALAEELVRRWSDAKAAEAKRKRAEVTDAVRMTIFTWPAYESPPTKKAVLRKLRRETGLPKNLLIREIHAQWRA